MNNIDYNLYVLAELSYKNEHLDLKEDMLYPDGWYYLSNYKEKNEIIVEAIKEKKLIKDTDRYKKLFEKKD